MTNNCNSVNHTHLIFRAVKAATEAWIALEDESEEEEIDEEEEEKETRWGGCRGGFRAVLISKHMYVNARPLPTHILENCCFEVDLSVK